MQAATGPTSLAVKERTMINHRRRTLTRTAGVEPDGPRVVVSPSALATLESTVGLRPAESGAILFADREGTIALAGFDGGSRATTATYSPDLALAKRIDRWAATRQGLEFVGFAHSHPAGHTVPSSPDREYANRLMAFKGRDRLWLPIVQTVPDTGAFSVHWWEARRTDGPPGTLAEIVPATAELAKPVGGQWLDRVRGTLDLDALREARVIAAGVGGARSALEDLARAGVGQFVLIDPDAYQQQNLATQHGRRAELGVGKAMATAEAIRDINPDAAVVAVPGRVEDVLGEATARAALLRGELAGRRARRVLLGAWTDNHAANAFLAHMGLTSGVPVVFTDLFQEAGAGAVAFVAPGLTPGCHRCWVHGRYAHYEAGGVNPVTSAGAEIWATSRINALKTRLCLLLLQSSYCRVPGESGADAGRTDDLVRTLSASPAAVVKLRPDCAELTGFGGFARFEDGLPAHLRPALALDTTLWLRIPPRKDCPECGGTGDLSSCIVEEAGHADQ